MNSEEKPMAQVKARAVSTQVYAPDLGSGLNYQQIRSHRQGG